MKYYIHGRHPLIPENYPADSYYGKLKILIMI